MSEGAQNKILSKLTSHEQDVLIAFLSNLKPGAQPNVEVDYDGLATALRLSSRISAHDAWKGVQKKLFGDAKPSLVLGPRSKAKSEALIPKTCTSFTSPVVALWFLSETHKLSIHRDMLLEIPYFEDELDAVSPQETSVRILRFPEHSQTTGEQLVRWLYYKELPEDIHEVSHLEGQDASAANRRVFDSYLLATELGMEDWANHLINLFAAFRPKEIPLFSVFRELHDEIHGSMKHLVMTMCALLVRDHGMRSDTCATVKDFTDKVKVNGEFAVDLIEHMHVLGQRSLEDITKADKCAWHTHVRTEKCS
ncbi:uncharacterized protein Z520_01286 [Fonsecaea multimorphosa CBS 102226]|uniref:BTB domain-containing protein n=1 Tax=Fonsecaea multimorphosa CBS 102226 TaxID=1442371 RepID=A0A0D2HLQ2_9EURO|nr:uncharacterized protein Z520_01286 [Fonsecaea multimorphosa CBS 102226]KIY02821.1 hypothetical protein Z520_01286 [Fonsecaea multimorphosa CBS 102226]OAL30986.1 hypothetical protein AYO22_01281 [Fonsecaea multimorphosa]